MRIRVLICLELFHLGLGGTRFLLGGGLDFALGGRSCFGPYGFSFGFGVAGFLGVFRHGVDGTPLLVGHLCTMERA